MRTTTVISTLLAAAACVSASSHSHPVLAFTSSQASSTKLQLPSESTIDGFVNSLFASGKSSPACQLDAIALVQADHLDRNTFASLRHSSTDSLRARSLDAPSQVTFNVPESDISARIESRLKEACGATVHSRVSALEKVGSSDHLLFASINIGDLRNEESALLKSLQSLDETHPRNLVIIANQGRLHQYTKRQVVAVKPSSSNGNWTEPHGGVFAKYQLFSTPLLLTLILVGGVLLPIVYFAVAQLAQVQTPDQMGVRKDPISGDKKQQ
ncbi:hypothetical protein PSEUBRA_000119 [Kalmanozyma brasiliensis GHG001]|uniref:Protein BIG1 n=1 Tax=Kalmanozyma brasiliensis (strain GHG001) TaxID=1365824 RepID=V5F0C4_KALBG|nr:uncharacterized protein PSEUBRA_000119 [Kalmanozyma brasiliensis GHG001]EST09738.1 hypothetical protein PSEUBRA_000119 [Kalmanozyma brasiliensis GHG001]